MGWTTSDDQDKSMWGCDYESYMIPASEGGKGPEDARSVLGIECNHHYGITLHPIVEGKTIADQVYKLTRGWHPARADGSGVTDDNHTWKDEPSEKPGRFSRIILFKNEKSPPFINIFNAPSWLFSDGPGAKWFDQFYRVATVGIIAAEIANNLRRRDEYLASALKFNEMTIVGRKNAVQRREWAADCLRLNRVLLKRHPQLAYLAGYDEEGFARSEAERLREQRNRYMIAAKLERQKDTPRSLASASRLDEWARIELIRLRNAVRGFPNLAHLVPGEELAAA